jgi:hypothetical protein
MEIGYSRSFKDDLQSKLLIEADCKTFFKESVLPTRTY